MRDLARGSGRVSESGGNYLDTHRDYLDTHRNWMMTMRGSIFMGLVWCGALLNGCSSQRAAPQVPTTGADAESLLFGPCPDEWGGARVECSLVEVSQDWDSQGRNTSVLVRRVRAAGPSRGSLWTLDGGPGFAGDSYLAPEFLSLAQEAGLDIYIPSHRGAAGDSLLACPKMHEADSPGGGRATPAEWSACLTDMEEKWGPDLSDFTVRAGAQDVAHVMSLAEDEGQRLVFGGSYGSLWAQRLLLDTDARIDRVLLDSLVPIGASLERVEEHADGAVENLLNACATAADCAALFEGDPVEMSRAAIAKFGAGEGCGESRGLERKKLQALVHGLLQGPPESWIKIVALFERLVRCDERSLQELQQVLKKPGGAGSGPQDGPVHYSPVLNRHLLYRELYLFDRSESERADFLETALAVDPNTESIMAEAAIFGAEHRVEDDAAKPESSVEALLASGQLDPLDPPAWATTFAESLPKAQLLSVPWAGHSVLRYLGLQQNGCGASLLEAFFRGDAWDLSCVDEQPAPDLAAHEVETQEMLNEWFGGPL